MSTAAERSARPASSQPDRPSALAVFADRQFRILILLPAVAVLLLIGLFPVIYSLIVSFQKINRRVTDTSFQGLDNYIRLFTDDRFWESVLHTGLVTAIALPLELLFGLLLAWLFLNRMPGRQTFIALLLLPAVMAPFVAGAIWRLMFDNSLRHAINTAAGLDRRQGTEERACGRAHRSTTRRHYTTRAPYTYESDKRLAQWNAVHVPDPAGRELSERRPLGSWRRRRSTGASGLAQVPGRSCPAGGIKGRVVNRGSSHIEGSTLIRLFERHRVWALTRGGHRQQ